MKKNKLEKRILFSLLSLPFIIILINIFYSGYLFYNKDIDTNQNLANSISENLIDKIDRNFYERYGDVQAFSISELAIKAFDNAESRIKVREYMNTLMGIYVLYDYMLIADINGKIIAVNTSDKEGKPIPSDFLIGKNVSEEGWFVNCKRADNTNFSWYSDFMFDKTSSQLYQSKGAGMGFASPIFDKNGNIKGIWYNYANWNEITLKIKTEIEVELVKRYPNSEILLTNREGLIISSKVEDEIGRFRFASDGSVETVLPRLELKNYIIGKATSQGAYSYLGKRWNCYTLISKGPGVLRFIFTYLKGVVVLTLISIVITVVVAIRLSRNLARRINANKNTLSNVSLGKLDTLEVEGDDEIADAANSINGLIKDLSLKADFAKNIGNGNLSATFKPVSEFDTLGISLLNMRNNLLQVSNDEKRRMWTSQGITKFGDLLRNENDLKVLGDTFVANLVKYVEANQATLFLTNVQANENDFTLDTISTYAYDRFKHIQNSIHVGEGLVGQCYYEKKTIQLTNIPNNYISITSGLGDSAPKYLLLVPLIANQKIEGIIELASFQILEQYKVDFIEKVSNDFASILSMAKINANTKQLLESSQQQGEELRTQEEEMRQNMEEMLAVQEDLERKIHELSQKSTESRHILKAINDYVAIVEFTKKGEILNANQYFLNKTKYNLDEIKGLHHQIFVPEPYRSSEEYSRFWQDLAGGENKSGIFERMDKDGNRFYLKGNYIMVKDDDLGRIRIIKFAVETQNNI